MNKLLKYLIYLSILSIIVGPLGVLPLGIPQVNIYFTDVIIGLIGLIWIIQPKKLVQFIRSDKISIYFCIFVGIAAISLIISPINLNLSEKFISSLYLIRLFSYFFVYLTIRYLTDSSTPGESLRDTPGVSLWLLTKIGLILAVLGWLQYFFYPDLRNLYYLGWDPHFKRIFSTYLDPNYFGLMMVLTLISLFCYERFTWKESLRNTLPVFVRTPGRWMLVLFIFATFMFTYSRSSFLAIIAAGVYLSVMRKNLKSIIAIIFIIFTSSILLPRPGGVGVQLERVFSIETRIENWQQAFKIFTDYPILGVGFNTVRYAKTQYNFSQDNLSESHAAAGFDNSFLFVAATTGLIGFFSYLLFVRKVFQRGNLWVKTSLTAIIIHSFFLNSLFFPWVMLWMWVILGINVKTQMSNVKT